MRVLITHERFLVSGGAEIIIEKQIGYLKEKGASICIACLEMLPLIREKYLGLEIKTGSYPQLKGWVHENYNRFDLIISHNHPAELLLWPIKGHQIWCFNEPPSYNLLGGQPINPVEKMMVQMSINKVVVANKANQKIFSELYGLSPEVNMYGVDAEFFKEGNAGAFREKYGLGNSFLVSSVGWFNPFKNQLQSVKAYLEIKNLIPDCKLVLAGYYQGTSEKAEIDRFLQEQEGVIFTGHISREQVRELYHASNVVLCPFRKQGGFLSILEAMCSGTPIVASEECLLAEDLTESGSGIVTSDYVQAILEIYQGKEVKGKEWASQFTWERYLSRLEEVID